MVRGERVDPKTGELVLQPGRRSSTRRIPHAKGTPHISERMQRLLTGELPMEELTYEELRRGKLADVNGTFKGRPPAMIPAKFHTMMQRELLKRMQGQIQEQVERAIGVVIEVMEEGEGASETIESRGERITTKAGTGRLKAAQYIIERVMGKVPDKTEITANVTVWEGLQEGGELLIDIDEEEAEIVESTPPVRKKRMRTRPIPPSDVSE